MDNALVACDPIRTSLYFLGVLYVSDSIIAIVLLMAIEARFSAALCGRFRLNTQSCGLHRIMQIALPAMHCMVPALGYNAAAFP